MAGVIGLVAGLHAEALGQLLQRAKQRRCSLRPATSCQPSEVRPMRQRLRGPQRLGHDAVDARARRRVHGRRRAPDGEDGLVGLERAVADQQAQQIAFLAREIAVPRRLAR